MGTGAWGKLPSAWENLSISGSKGDSSWRWSALRGDAWRRNKQEGGIILSALQAQQKETENGYSVSNIYSLI